MLRFEYVDGGTRIHHYSDEDFKILQVETGIIYDDAIDVLPCKWTYEETDMPIEKEEPEDDNNQKLYSNDQNLW